MMRLVARGLAVTVALSPWFLSFFMFAFLSLAIAKRQIELCALRESDRADGRAWRAADLPVAAALGAASGVASVIVFALYIQSPEVGLRYDQPEFLWPVCSLLIYWLGRMTLLANRGAADHDPVEFTLKDRTSWLTSVGPRRVRCGDMTARVFMPLAIALRYTAFAAFATAVNVATQYVSTTLLTRPGGRPQGLFPTCAKQLPDTFQGQSGLLPFSNLKQLVDMSDRVVCSTTSPIRSVYKSDLYVILRRSPG